MVTASTEPVLAQVIGRKRFYCIIHPVLIFVETAFLE